MWLAFTDPAWRRAIVNWEATAGRMVANLRIAMADHVGDAPWRNFVSRLKAVSPEFAELWDRHAVHRSRTPAYGPSATRSWASHFEVSNTWLGPRSGARLQVLTPTDAKTERRLHELVNMPEDANGCKLRTR